MYDSILKFIRPIALPLVSSAVLAAAPLLVAQTAATCSVTVKVTGIRNTDGNISVALRSAPETIVQHKVVEIDPATMSAAATFDGMARGTYDIAVIHDENKNGKLDFNEMGMPLEGYGHSNNPAKRPGPPSFEETKFTIDKPAASIEVTLIYWP